MTDAFRELFYRLVNQMGSETLLFVAALFNKSHNERSGHYE
jgi:hypothetical protein